MTLPRRMGPPGSANWTAMVEAAEAILREQGYGALSSRTVAERVGVKQRLVYYYFRTMDELIVASFRRLAGRELDRLHAALGSQRPLHELWSVCIHTSDARLIAEFSALANRSAGLRAEVTGFIEESRRIQVEALRRAAGDGIGEARPEAVALLATSLALSITREAQLGIATGHAEAARLVAAVLARLEPGPTRGGPA